jgi:hypothetical protein
LVFPCVHEELNSTLVARLVTTFRYESANRNHKPQRRYCLAYVRGGPYRKLDHRQPWLWEFQRRNAPMSEATQRSAEPDAPPVVTPCLLAHPSVRRAIERVAANPVFGARLPASEPDHVHQVLLRQ